MPSTSRGNRGYRHVIVEYWRRNMKQPLTITSEVASQGFSVRRVQAWEFRVFAFDLRAAAQRPPPPNGESHTATRTLGYARRDEVVDFAAHRAAARQVRVRRNSCRIDIANRAAIEGLQHGARGLRQRVGERKPGEPPPQPRPASNDIPRI